MTPTSGSAGHFLLPRQHLVFSNHSNTGVFTVSSIKYFAWDITADQAEKPCIRDDFTELTYGQFAQRVDSFAAQLSGLGVRSGDVIATMLGNRVELLVAMMGAWRIGAAATPVNPTFTEVEARHQISDAGAVLAVIEDGVAAPTGVTPLHVRDICATPVSLGAPGSLPDDRALVIYTSGSTGRPKGVELTHSNLQYMSSAMVEHFSLTDTDHSMLILPLFHVNAICVSVLAPLLAGGQVSITGRFSPSRFFRDVSRLKPTYFSAVPTIYALLASQPDEVVGLLASQPDEVVTDTSSLRFAVCGAAPIARELLDRAESRFGFVIVEGYGLTEGTCASACNPLSGPRKPGTVGPALPGQQITVCDELGHPLPSGYVGEVVIEGPNVMRGYLHRPHDTQRAIRDGRLHTGDLGRLDEDGYLTLVDRIKDLIIRGGENIYPKEIENALSEHPAVLEAAVVGAPDHVYGEVPVAYAVAYPEATVTDLDLLDHLRTRLAKVKLPVSIHVVSTLPRNPVGKIDKPGLRRRLREQLHVHS